MLKAADQRANDLEEALAALMLRNRALETITLRALQSAALAELQRHEASGRPLTDEAIGRVAAGIEEDLAAIVAETRLAIAQTNDVAQLLRHYRAQGTKVACAHPHPKEMAR